MIVEHNLVIVRGLQSVDCERLGADLMEITKSNPSGILEAC